MANLYTKTGDKGSTSLVGGTRVSKADLRVSCYGTIDEANSMLGLAYAQTDREYLRKTIRTIQGRLFSLGAELASDAQGIAKLKNTISEKDIAFLENVVDTCTETTGKQTHFVIPGVDPTSAALHVARTIMRRAERGVVELREKEPVREQLAQYINRLSDAIYALARLQENLVAQDQLREKVTEMVRQAMAQTDSEPFTVLDLPTAQKMAERAKQKSAELGVPIVFVAVDAGGNLILAQRMEGALLGSIDVAMGKAYTANAYKIPTHVLGEISQPQGGLYGIQYTLPGKTIVFGGGFPFVVAGEVLGGIGVSGGSAEQDMAIAQYAMQKE